LGKLFLTPPRNVTEEQLKKLHWKLKELNEGLYIKFACYATGISCKDMNAVNL